MSHTITLTFSTAGGDSNAGAIARFIDLFRSAYQLAAQVDVSSVDPMSFESGWKPALHAVREAARSLSPEQRAELARGSQDSDPLEVDVLLAGSPLTISVTGGKPALVAASLLAGGRLVVGSRTVEADLGSTEHATRRLKQSLFVGRSEKRIVSSE
ncbi:MAG: hypothetical protein ACREIA_18835 [Opitutaceae bacterium]